MTISTRRGVFKRAPEIPDEARGILAKVSKAELFECVWALAGLCNGADSCEDNGATRARVIEEINAQRARRGARPFKEKRARVCRGCGQPHTHTCVADSIPGLGGYWHLTCLEKAKAAK